MENIFGNNLLMQYLSAAGAAMSEGKPIASALNPITQQNIAAQSKIKAQNAYLKQLSDTLKTAGGKEGKSAVSFGPDGSMSLKLDSDRLGTGDNIGALQTLLSGPGLTDDAPQGGATQQPANYQQLSQMLSGMNKQQPAEGDDGIIESPLPPVQAAPQSGQQMSPQGNVYSMLMRQMLNPQTSPVSMSNADLAGLTPQDLSQALSGQLAMEEMRQRQLTGVSDMAHRQWTESKTKDDPEALIYPVPVWGQGQVTARQWKELPTDIKSYSAYRHLQQQANPNEKVVSFKEYQSFGKEHHIDMLKALQNDPSLMETELMLRKSGATNISMDPGERAEKTTIGTSAGKMQSGDFMQGVREDLMKEGVRDVWYNPPAYKELRSKGMDDDQATAKARELMILKETDRRVRSQFPKDKVERRMDGWYVNGELKVRYTP